MTDSSQALSHADTLLANYKPLHSPRKAAFYSAVLPSLGQIYNREYWKMPPVYATLGVSTVYTTSVTWTNSRN